MVPLNCWHVSFQQFSQGVSATAIVLSSTAASIREDHDFST